MKYILILASLALASCAFGPDSSPEVQAHAASFGGYAIHPQTGMPMMMGAPQVSRKTMMHD